MKTLRVFALSVALLLAALNTFAEDAKFLSPCGCDPSDGVNPEWAWAEFDVHGAMRRAVDKIRPQFDSGKLAYRLRGPADWADLDPGKIEVTFLPCDFWMPTAKTWKGDLMITGGMCVAGMGDGMWRDMFISVRSRSKVEALIEWEMGNIIMRYFGRDDWSDRWNRMTPDPGYHPASQNRRYSVGR